MKSFRRLIRNEDGVTEVVGYILTFALSAIILLISVQSFTVARQNSEAVITVVEMRNIANRIATRVVEAGLAGQEFPNATFEVVVNIPKEFNGREYSIQLMPEQVLVVSTDGLTTVSASTFRLDAIYQNVGGTVYSQSERVIVSYSYDGGDKTITIREA